MQVAKTEMIEIRVGDMAGEKAYVTWKSDEEKLLRATPVRGNPLWSFEYKYGDVIFLDE